MERKTDSVAKLNQIANGTQGQSPDSWTNGQWLKKTEDFTCKFLEYLFAVSRPGGGPDYTETEINNLLSE
jgi:hypothetical protein